jgi:hypothetical protein
MPCLSYKKDLAADDLIIHPFFLSAIVMSQAQQNPDTRPLPPGWIQQYDRKYAAITVLFANLI